jgi:hypothetical protein
VLFWFATESVANSSQIDNVYIPWTNKLYELLVLYNAERDRVLNTLDMPLATFLGLLKHERDDIINNDRPASDAAWTLAICQTTFNRILHFEEVHGNRTGDLISMPTSAPKSQQDYLKLLLREKRMKNGTGVDLNSNPRLPRFLMVRRRLFATESALLTCLAVRHQ